MTNLDHSYGAYWMRLTRWESGTRTVALVNLGDAVPTSKDLSELPSVEDTIDVGREDEETNVPTAVSTPKEPGAVERSRHELTHMLWMSWCFSCVAGRGRTTLTANLTATADLQEWSATSCVESCALRESCADHLEHDRESQSMAAAVTVKAASDVVGTIRCQGVLTF